MQWKWMISARRQFAVTLAFFMVVSLFPTSFVVEAARIIDNKKSSNYLNWKTLKLNERVRSQVAGNLDNAGHADFAVITEDNLLVMYYVSSDGTLTRQPVAAKQADPNLERLHIADLNGDQIGEVLAFGKSQIEIFGRDTTGSYVLKSTIPISPLSAQVVEDFNKDGITDLIVVSDTKLHYLRGSANLAYQEVGSYTHKGATSTSAVSIKTGDWNNDGHLDFIYWVYGQQAVLFKGDGQVGFTHIKDLDIDFFVTDDMNQDGFTDIIGYSVVGYEPKYAVYYGDAGGQFTRKSPIGFVNEYLNMYSTDVNQDGYPDLVLYDPSNYYSYVLWNRKGTYSVPEQINFLGYPYKPSQKLDFDKDGREDFVSRQDYYTWEIMILRNQDFSGQVQFSQAKQEVDAHQQSVEVQVQRIGGNSGLTLVEYETSDGTAKSGVDYVRRAGVLEFSNGETTKSLTIPIISVDRIEDTRTFSIQLKNPTSGVALGDHRKMNVDIRSNASVPHWPKGAVADIADVTSNSVTVVWPQAQDSTGIQSYEISEINQALAPISVTKEVYSYTWGAGLVPGKTYHLQVKAKNVNGKFSQTLAGHITIPSSNTALAAPYYRTNSVNFRNLPRHYEMNAVDSNGDGFDELFVYDQSVTMIMKPLSNQSWLFNGRLPIGQSGEVNSSEVNYRAHLNRDQKEEWLAPGPIGIRIISEGASLDYEQVAELQLEPHYDLKVADFTNDGIADIIYMNYGAELIILKGNGSYGYTEISRQRLSHHGVQILVGDWNGDGLMDMAASDGNLHLYKNKGNYTFEKIKEIHSPTTPQAADFNGDGYDDIVTFHWGSDVFVYYGDAQGTFDGKPYRYTPPYGVYEIHLADLNNDSNKDFVLVYFSGVEAVVNQGKGIFQPQGLYDEMMWLGSRYLMGDFNGDGKDDIGYRRENYSGFTLYDNMLTSSSLQFSNASQNVQESAEYVQVKVKRVGDRHGVTSVVYGTEDGTALAGVDYASSTGTLTFADGETEKTVKIPLIKNGKMDTNRTFKVKLQSPTRGAKLGQHHQLEVNIRDDINLAPTWPIGAKLSVSDVTYRSFTISWPNAVDLDGIASYEIVERDGALAPVSVAGNINSHTWSSGLTPGKSYRLQVRAKDKKGLISWPLQTCVTVQACVKLPQPLPNVNTPIEQPVGPPSVHQLYVVPKWLNDTQLNVTMRRVIR
ncbi:FG-GAP-like repeat-containing protein [Paenibacillus sp. SC116]|uniref:FG-GAP-like repeat-containing protein n=1 Tax=Paenibacillus sp. SC116 TaxID=2968986 RepID=UPI00215AF11D|nr:FG-GAP-like repeat-containing protein [Paenibacillus sp. SC116]MCR8843958.1 FG-GAP-like repeat-containing protein [Paenibacillus sp. SC116]